MQSLMYIYDRGSRRLHTHTHTHTLTLTGCGVTMEAKDRVIKPQRRNMECL
jgi:hypothetical protein